MTYLYFDIECARCGSRGQGYICEFGYVLADEKFNTLEQGHFLINPNESFDEYALRNLLHYSEEEYCAQPEFPEFYKRIMDLLTAENRAVVGHTTSADFKYVSSECDRYGLPRLSYSYYDIRIPFKILQKESQAPKLESMLIKLGLEKFEQMHNAHIDAVATMTVCKRLCEMYGLTIDELLSLQMPKKQKKNPRKTTIGEELVGKGVDMAKFFS